MSASSACCVMADSGHSSSPATSQTANFAPVHEATGYRRDEASMTRLEVKQMYVGRSQCARRPQLRARPDCVTDRPNQYRSR